MFEGFVRFIRENYLSARKIVEVGVGHRIDVALMVKMSVPGAEVIVTDKDENWVRSRRTTRVRMVADDVLYPSLPIYQGAKLIYSLHPPLELVPALQGLARSVGADLLVVPVADERESFRQEDWKSVLVDGRVVAWKMNIEN
jgi:uncharacterized UPF0146 family protein